MSRKFSTRLVGGVVLSLVMGACGSQTTSPAASPGGGAEGGLHGAVDRVELVIAGDDLGQAAAGFGNKAHAGGGTPVHSAFHGRFRRCAAEHR